MMRKNSIVAYFLFARSSHPVQCAKCVKSMDNFTFVKFIENAFPPVSACECARAENRFVVLFNNSMNRKIGTFYLLHCDKTWTPARIDWQPLIHASAISPIVASTSFFFVAFAVTPHWLKADVEWQINRNDDFFSALLGLSSLALCLHIKTNFPLKSLDFTISNSHSTSFSAFFFLLFPVRLIFCCCCLFCRSSVLLISRYRTRYAVYASRPGN